MTSLTPLSPSAEELLHSKRLFPHEERRFRALSKRLVAPTNPINSYLRRTVTVLKPPPPVDDEDGKEEGEMGEDGEIDFEDAMTEDKPNAIEQENEVPEETQIDSEQYLRELKIFHANIVHDCSSLTASLARIQLLLSANETERARYADQVVEIKEKCQNVKGETVHLRNRLETAKAEMERRKRYDLLAEDVLYEMEDEVAKTKDQVEGVKRERVRAKTREELRVASEKLRDEIVELEDEQDELGGQWVARRDALDGVLVAGRQLQSVIRGEAEGEEGGDGEDEEPDGEQDTRRDDEDPDVVVTAGGLSDTGTPRHPGIEGGASPMPDEMGSDGGRTPLPITSGLKNEILQSDEVPQVHVEEEQMDTS